MFQALSRFVNLFSPLYYNGGMTFFFFLVTKFFKSVFIEEKSLAKHSPI